MADLKLSNIASITGNYDSIAPVLTFEAVITSLIFGLTIVKTADKENWASGYLTYTITARNNVEKTLKFSKNTNTLEPNLIILVENSIKKEQLHKNTIILLQLVF